MFSLQVIKKQSENKVTMLLQIIKKQNENKVTML